MNEKITIDISPRIVLSNASLYNDVNRVFMEYIDNSIDSAETLFSKDGSYERDIKINVNFEGVNSSTKQLIITDNCLGMDNDGLLHVIQDIGNSDKKAQPWTNGQFGYGVYSFLAICKEIEIISKVDSQKPRKISINRDLFEKDKTSQAELLPPEVCPNHLFEYKSGTKIILKEFDKDHRYDINISNLKEEIEKHFEQLLARKNISVSLSNNIESFECLPFQYDSYEGDYYSDYVKALEIEERGAKRTLHCDEPLKVYIRITPGQDINRRPVIISNGRRISEISSLKSFKSKNKQTIWNHPNLTGYIDVKNFVDPTIARNDFRNNKFSKALFNYLINIEESIEDLISSINKKDEERHYNHLENELNKALSALARMDRKMLKYRTEIISGKEIPLQDGGDDGFSEGIDEKVNINVNQNPDPDNLEVGDTYSDDTDPNIPNSNIDPNNNDNAQKIESENPYDDSDKSGKKTRRSGFNVRINDGPPDIIMRDGEPVEQRSILAGDTIEIFKQHPDFKSRVRKTLTQAHKISRRMITYLAGEMTVHYKDMWHNKLGGGTPEYNKDMFIDLTDSIYKLEEMLSPLKDKNLTDLDSND